MALGHQIAARLVWNLDWLEKGGWSEMEGQFRALAGIARNAPAADCIKIERQAARVAMGMDGIGPKQSRNLWICLGLTRYEIPTDTRVTEWFNERQASFIEKKNLSISSHYEATQDRIQSLCKEAVCFRAYSMQRASSAKSNPNPRCTGFCWRRDSRSGAQYGNRTPNRVLFDSVFTAGPSSDCIDLAHV